MQNTNTYTPNEMKMRELMEKKQYARALEALAKIIKQKEVWLPCWIRCQLV